MSQESIEIEKRFNSAVAKQKIQSGSFLGSKKLLGDASTRRYYRVNSTSGSYVASFATLEQAQSFQQVHQAYHENHVRVPFVFDCDVQDGYFLQEDLGEQTFLKQLAEVYTIEEEYQLYKKVLDQLFAIHLIDADKYQKMDFSSFAFDEEKLMYEVSFTMTHFIDGLMKCDLSQDIRQKTNSMFVKICQELEKISRVVTHRDYHSRNVMVAGDEMVVIDFQDSRMGPPQYDLVSLLDDCYYHLDSGNVEKMKRDYWDNMGAVRRSYSKSYEQFEYHYDLMAIQRLFKAIGSFAYLFNSKNDHRYLRHIGFAFENMKKKLFKYRELNDLRIMLSRVHYEY